MTNHPPEEVIRFRITAPRFRAIIGVGVTCHTVHTAPPQLEFLLLKTSREVAAICRDRHWRVERLW